MLTFKKVEIIEKADAHNFDFTWQFNPSDLFHAQGFCQEIIIGNYYLKSILVRIPLKQLDYALSISMR